jgi:UDP-glucose 4-epimerase
MGRAQVSIGRGPGISRTCIVGGAGFIGSHFVDRLLDSADTESVTVFDNFTSGREWHLDGHAEDPRLRVVRGDATELEVLAGAVAGNDTVIHLASNPDIARAVVEPAIDFDSGTLLTHHVLEAMRLSGATRIVYASGSGIYGDLGELEVDEDHGPLSPISTYGASKLAGEALISAYCHMFGLRGYVFRFGNVVGPRQTHGVGYDFIRRLTSEPAHLRVLGDGRQSKSYIHVADVVEAVLMAAARTSAPVVTYNVATGDYMTVGEIASMALEVMGLDPQTTQLEFTGSDRGWSGDVPVVRLSTKRLRALGWTNARSTRAAMRAALDSILEDVSSGRLT